MVSRGLTVLALVLCANQALGVSHPHKHLPGFFNEPVPRERGTDVWTAIYIMWSFGAVCLAWVAYQGYRWWKIHGNSQTYQTLLEHEPSTLHKRVFLSDSFSEYLKQTNTFGLCMTVCSMLIVLYVTIYTIHIAHFIANHKRGVHGISAITFKRTIGETPVGTDAQEYVDFFQDPDVWDLDEMKQAMEQAKELSESDVFVVKETTITKIVHVGECTSLPSVDPGNQNKQFTFFCDAEGKLSYTYWEDRTMCTGHKYTGEDPHPVHDDTFEGVSIMKDDEGNDITGELELTCDKDTMENGEFTQIIMKQEWYMKVIPCDFWKEDEEGDDYEICQKYADQEEAYTTVWECDTCYGKQLGKDPSSDDWEVHDMHGCIMIPMLTPYFRDAMNYRVLRDGGDGICSSYKQADQGFLDEMDYLANIGGMEARMKEFEDGHGEKKVGAAKPYKERGARRILANGVLEKIIPEELVAERRKFHIEKQDEIFHNHENRDEMVKIATDRLGIIYNEDTREWEIAEGEDESSVRHKLRKHNLEQESDKRRRAHPKPDVGYAAKVIKKNPSVTDIRDENGNSIKAFSNHPQERDYAGSCPRQWLGDHSDSAYSSQAHLNKAADETIQFAKVAQCVGIATWHKTCTQKWFPSGLYSACHNIQERHSSCVHLINFLRSIRRIEQKFKQKMQYYIDGTLKPYCNSKGLMEYGAIHSCYYQTCSGVTYYYPGWEGSISFAAVGKNYNVGIGFGASMDSVEFSYVYWSTGFIAELLAVSVATMQNTHIGTYSDFLGWGGSACVGGEIPLIETGWSICWGWPNKIGPVNNFQIGVGWGVGFFPISLEATAAYVTCLSAGCI